MPRLDIRHPHLLSRMTINRFPVLDLAQAEADYHQRKAAEARQAQMQAEAKRAAEVQRASAGHSISVPNREQRQRELAQNSRNRFKLKSSGSTAASGASNNGGGSAAASVGGSLPPAAASSIDNTAMDTSSSPASNQQPPPPPYIGGDGGRDTNDALEEIGGSFQPTIVAIGRGRPSSDNLNPAKRPRQG